MYTNERDCEICSENGRKNDGENLCRHCQKYICLQCAQRHGQVCAKIAYSSIKPNIQYMNIPKSDSYLSRTNGTTGWLKQIKFNKTEIRNGHTSPKNQAIHSADKTADVPTSGSVKNESKEETLNIHLADNKSNNATAMPRVEGNVQDRNRIERTSSKGSKEERRHYSAQGGILRIGSSSGVTAPSTLQRCALHSEVNIENYCSRHEALCCEECLLNVHNCCTVQPIDEVAHGITESKQYVKIIEEAYALRETYSDIISRYQSFLRSKEQPLMFSVSSSTDKKETVMDEQSQTEHYSTLKNVENHLSKCKDINDSVEVCLSSLKNATESGSEMLTFITFHKNKHIILTAKEKLCEFIPDIGVISSLNSTEQNVHQRNADDKTTQDEKLPTKTKPNDADEVSISAMNIGDSKPRLIGEVVISLRGSKDNSSPLNENENKSDLIKGYDEDECVSVNDNVAKQPQSATFEKSAISLQKTNESRPQSQKKNVLFSGSRDPVFNSQPKGIIKTNGLVTEYYMNDDLADDIRVLRLQSAPPERTIHHEKQKPLRPMSMYSCERKEMIQWQNRKILESVETRSDLTHVEGHLFVKSNDDILRKKQLFKTSNPKLEITPRSEKQLQATKVKQLRRSRKDNAKSPRHNSKNKADGSAKTNKVNSFENLSESQRLQKWITQTEEINKNWSGNKSSSHSSTHFVVTDGIDEVYAANVALDHETHNADTPVVPLMVKEATVIKAANREERSWSAKSRASESEECIYNNQSYAFRPKSELLLTDEQIVRLPEDIHMCQINSIACMPDGRIVVSDFNNKLIKIFRVGWGKASVLVLDEPPHGISAILNTTVAVISGLAYDKLLLVNVGQYLSVKRRFKCGCMCKDVASYESHIYLLCMYRYKTEVRVLTMDGVVSIRMDLGHNIPSPRKIALRPTDGLIYIADEKRGIFNVQMGKIVSRSFDKNIESYEDVTIDINNTVFICTKNPCGIYELSYDGKHLMPIILGYGVEGAQAIAFSTSNNSLVVGCTNAETIQIYKIRDTLALKSK